MQNKTTLQGFHKDGFSIIKNSKTDSAVLTCHQKYKMCSYDSDFQSFLRR